MKYPNDRGVQSVRREPSALSSCRADRFWPDFHIRHLPVSHRLALRLDVATRALLLPDRDYQRLRYARGILALGFARSRCVQDHYLVYHMVERGARSHHGGSVPERRRGTRPLVGRCARALPRRDRTCSPYATRRAGLSAKPAGACVFYRRHLLLIVLLPTIPSAIAGNIAVIVSPICVLLFFFDLAAKPGPDCSCLLVCAQKRYFGSGIRSRDRDAWSQHKLVAAASKRFDSAFAQILMMSFAFIMDVAPPIDRAALVPRCATPCSSRSSTGCLPTPTKL